MERPSLDKYWLSMLPLISSRGTCPRRQVAAILVDKDGRLVSTGYNGSAPGAPHCFTTPCAGSPLLNGLRDDCEALHAEANAVMQATSSRRVPWTLYCDLSPCFSCAKLMLAADIQDVVACITYAHDRRGPDLLVRNGVGMYLWNKGVRQPWK